MRVLLYVPRGRRSASNPTTSEQDRQARAAIAAELSDASEEAIVVHTVAVDSNKFVIHTVITTANEYERNQTLARLELVDKQLRSIYPDTTIVLDHEHSPAIRFKRSAKEAA